MKSLGSEPRVAEKTKVKINLIPHYYANIEQFWDQYSALEGKFRQSLGLPKGSRDIETLRGQIQRRSRANILAYSGSSILGFRRMSFSGHTISLGAVYVEPECRDTSYELNENFRFTTEHSSKLWQILTKAGYLLGRKGGYDTIEAFNHNRHGERIKKWVEKVHSKWDEEESQPNNQNSYPTEFINFLVSTKIS